MTDAELIAAFIAKRGVNKVDADASSGITDRQFYLASRGEISLKPRADDDALIQQRHRRGDMILNGLGEAIAHEPEFDEARWTSRHAGCMDF